MNIIKFPNDILTTKAQKIEKGDQEVINTLREMVKFVKNPENGAAGLALPQVGISKCGFVMNVETKQGMKTIAVMNPVFMKKGPLYVPKFTEKCLSIDEQEGFVTRHKMVMMRYTDLNWKPQTITLEGFNAVVAQHETDHLNGILFIDKMA